MKTHSLPVLILTCTLLQACSSMESNAIATADDKAALDSARTLLGPDWPANTQTRQTTDSKIYLANLDGQIEVLDRLVQSRPDDVSLARLALAYYHRFQILGRIEDAEAARQMLESAQDRPHQKVIDLNYAQIMLGFHEFSRVRQSIETARQNGATAEDIEPLERALERSTRALPVSQLEMAQGYGQPEDVMNLVLDAARLTELGQPDIASIRLMRAQELYQDSSPFTLAWIHVQQGIVFLRNGDYGSALAFFAAAHDRLPEYYLATEHLAEVQLALGNTVEAAELYQWVAAQTGYPEFYYQLSRAQLNLGDEQAAGESARLAALGYADLLKRYPAMFADHATRYYMNSGRAETALELAQRNAGWRQDIRARTLLIEAQLNAGNKSAACNGVTDIRALGYTPPELPELAEALTRELKSGCRS